MVASFAYPVYNHIRLVVSNLSKKSFKSSALELKGLARMYGDDARLYLLKCLIEDLNTQEPKAPTDQHKLTLLRDEFTSLSSQSNFNTLICQAFAPHLGASAVHHFLRDVKLPLPLQLHIT